jgi:integrase
MATKRTDRPNSKVPWTGAYRDANHKEVTQQFATKREAEQWERDQRHALDHGTWVAPTDAKVSVAEYSEQWLARLRPSWAPATDAAVTNTFEKHVLPILGGRSLRSVQRSDVETLCASLKLAPSSVRLVHQHLGQMFTAAVEDGLLTKSPAHRARLPRVSATKAQPVALEAVERIHDCLVPWMQVAVPLGVGVGLRQAEASGLTVDAVDFLRRTVSVHRQLVDRNHEVPEFAPPKADSHRTVPLADFVGDALSAHLSRFERQHGDLVLLDPSGAPVCSGAFGHQWRRATRKAGAPGVRYHDLRHTFASTLLSRGVSIKAVSQWLGHKTSVTTLSAYAHLMPADEDTGRSVLDGAFADQARTSESNNALQALRQWGSRRPS